MDELEARPLTRTAHRCVHENRDVHNIVNIMACVNNAGHRVRRGVLGDHGAKITAPNSCGRMAAVRNVSMICDLVDIFERRVDGIDTSAFEESCPCWA
jgi:hypothetical protein